MNNRKFHAVLSGSKTICGRSTDLVSICGYKSFLLLADKSKCSHCVAALDRDGIATDWTSYVSRTSVRSAHGQEARAGV